MGKKAREGARMGGTAAGAENGGGTTGRGMDRDGGGNTSRADARQEARQARVDSAWSETVVQLKGIMENSGMQGD